MMRPRSRPRASPSVTCRSSTRIPATCRRVVSPARDGIAIFGPRCGPCLLRFGDEAARCEVNAQLKNLLGDTGGRAVEAMLAGADRRHNGLVAATIASGNVS